MSTKLSLPRTLAAGFLAGLAGAWMMNQFTRVWNNLVPQSQQNARSHPPLPYSQQEWDSTSRSAEYVGACFLRRRLTAREKKIGAQVMHFTGGGVGATVYGALTGQESSLPLTSGLAFGLLLWLAGEEIAMPLLGINDPPSAYSVAMHAQSLGEHVVYGIGTGFAFSALSAML